MANASDLESGRNFEQSPTEKEDAENERNDPERLLQCPFDKNHQIRAFRFPYHLVKCRKNHPALAQELKTCPFNARHLMPKDELAHHTETCQDRISVDPENAQGKDRVCRWHVPVSTWVNPNMTEDWDAEADDNASPFVWGTENFQNSVSSQRASSHRATYFRFPQSLPWSTAKTAAETDF